MNKQKQARLYTCGAVGHWQGDCVPGGCMNVFCAGLTALPCVAAPPVAVVKWGLDVWGGAQVNGLGGGQLDGPVLAAIQQHPGSTQSRVGAVCPARC